MQATKFTSEHVDSRIEAFIDWFTDVKLMSLSDEDFNQIVTSLIKAKKTADVTLEEEVNRNWNEIISGEQSFLFPTRKCRALFSKDFFISHNTIKYQFYTNF